MPVRFAFAFAERAFEFPHILFIIFLILLRHVDEINLDYLDVVIIYPLCVPVSEILKGL